ncbi:hypothetical protein B0H16DRAFT_1324847, partial [Mycena metata]
LCYPSGSAERLDMNVPLRGGTFSELDLFLANLFPNGFFSHRIARIPGTDIPLLTAWRIYFTTGKYNAPVNQCLLACFKIQWYGNIVIAKQRRGSDKVVQVRQNEDECGHILISL